jgi:Flp pilus assembly protein TadD
VQLLPDNHDLLTTRAEVFLATGSLPQALQDLQRARELRPDVPETFELLGRVCRAQGDDAGAEEHLQKALKIRAERR